MCFLIIHYNVSQFQVNGVFENVFKQYLLNPARARIFFGMQL